MSYVVDTSIWARSLHQNHPLQQSSKAAIKALLLADETIYLLPQNLYELWVVATRPSGENGFGLTADQARQQLEDMELLFEMKSDTDAIYYEWKALVIEHAVKGKVGHDARLVAAMKVHGITHLLTLNAGDFKRFSDITIVTLDQLLNPPARSAPPAS